MACCYILFSQKLNRFYIGSTSDDLNDRVHKHNTGYYGTKSFTAKAKDWTLFLHINTAHRKEAESIETKIKAQKSSVFIRNLQKYPEMREKLLASNG